MEDNKNLGLALRWSAAVSSMEALSKFNEQQLVQKELAWKNQIKTKLGLIPSLNQSLSGAFQSTPSFAVDYKEAMGKEPNSIVSVAVRDQFAPDRTWFSREALTLIQRWLAEDVSDRIDWNVVMSQNGSFSSPAFNGGNQLEKLKRIAAKRVYLTPPLLETSQVL